MGKKESNVFAVVVCIAMHMHKGICLKTDLKHGKVGEAGRLAQEANCLLSGCADLSLNPQNVQRRVGPAVHSCDFSTAVGGGRWRRENP